MKILVGTLIFLAAAVVLVWIGLQIRPRPFALFPRQPVELQTIPLPDGLPAPVERFYREVYGESIPVIDTAVITGRATMRISSITFPARFRFSHIAGQDYRHYIEATIYGLPLMKVNESYVDGKGRMELPFGTIENEPKIDQAANLGLWAESIWLPAVYLTDPLVRWEAIDDETARLVVPFEDRETSFIVRFDPQTNLVTHLEAMRYRDASDEAKILWIDEAIEWGMLNGQLTMTSASVTWMDQGSPWAVFQVEEIVFNQDLETYILQKGE